ncbi:hypothetical protein SCP_0606470 [Sparassis crispa]|uniref:Cytochrome P450 n=1 Tax=Sparassis crispa TaxID=139825 RepID=A0A401GR11_9APHY|nr:hypothetical protein SCP_0606470 [Sparassis crispa]GBE84668.1 hypothetical protein SCP_0606470 [Sparassis crispa]
MQDDEYRGYRIPGDTMVIPNIWAMSQDVTFYPKPQQFRPERFAEMDSQTSASRDPRQFVFGFGRRICPGRLFAEEGMWIAFASIIATMEITKARDVHGNDITPPLAFQAGFASRALPFRCFIHPRSSAIVDIVRQMNAYAAA